MKSPDFTFSIATCNVLYEPYYVQYVDIRPIDIKKRCLAFKQALESDNALKNVDILCFQEWPYNPGTLRKQFEGEKVIIKNKQIHKLDYFNNHATVQYKRFNEYLLKAYPADDYYYLMDSVAEKDGVLTIINKHKFKLLSYKFMIFTPNKKMLTALITPHQKHFPLGIINAHIPFDRKEELPKQFALMANEMNMYHIQQPWIVCGDFNYSVLKGKDTLNATKYKALHNFFPNMNK
jgi:endonuclease/exonuclease/phosphatase family metal-dependent hydrolase